MSLAGAALWRSSVRSHNVQEFQTTATDVNETLETLLNRDADFVSTLRAVLAMQPHLGATRFDRWFSALDGKRHQVGGLGTTVVEPVSASQLDAFLARRNADPAFRALVGGTILPVARSGRARYCLLSAGGTVTPYSESSGALLQGDWCDPTSPIGGYVVAGAVTAQVMRSSADSGQLIVFPVTAQGVSTLFFEAAFYRRGAPLGSVAQRRRAIAGWVESSFDIVALLRQAIGVHRGLNLTLFHTNPGQPERLIGRVGTAVEADSLTHDTTIQMAGRWRAAVRGSAVTGGLSPDVQGALVLAVGALMSSLLFSLILVLARSRERAFGMVREKTGELRHQALHDALTGLPNRVLVLDRAEQMLARARRNESLGGRAVHRPRRLQARQRHVRPRRGRRAAADGRRAADDGHSRRRHGGSSRRRRVRRPDRALHRRGCSGARRGARAGGAAPALRHARQAGRKLSVTASIGIATGARATADELLRDADLALYEAKAAGRSRCTMFESSMQTSSAGPADAGDGPRRRARVRAAVPALPAHVRSAHRKHDRRGGPDPLAPPRARRRLATGIHPDRRADRPDRADRALGAAGGVPQAALWHERGHASASR